MRQPPTAAKRTTSRTASDAYRLEKDRRYRTIRHTKTLKLAYYVPDDFYERNKKAQADFDWMVEKEAIAILREKCTEEKRWKSNQWERPACNQLDRLTKLA